MEYFEAYAFLLLVRAQAGGFLPALRRGGVSLVDLHLSTVEWCQVLLREELLLAAGKEDADEVSPENALSLFDGFLSEHPKFPESLRRVGIGLRFAA